MLPDLFFIINFTFAILASTVSLIVSFITIFIVYKNRPFRTFNNILICNTCMAAIFYGIVTIIASMFGFREDWSFNAPLCSFRAYCFNVAVATICHSKSMHAISRLFFAVLYKHRYLLTWRTHRILIALTWIISIVVCIPPFFIDNGYALEKESRSCVVSSKNYGLAFYITIVSCIIPFNIIVVVYILILFYVHRSTRRVWALSQNMMNTRNRIQKTKREVKVMKQMIIQTGILAPGGSIFLFLIAWHATQKQPPPECLYLLGFNLLTIVASTAPIAQFVMTKQLKDFIVQFVKRRQTTVNIIRPIHRQRQPWHLT